MGAIYLKRRFYLLCTLVCIIFALGLALPAFYFIGWIALFGFIAAIAIDAALVFREKNGINAHRSVADRLSNGDENPIEVFIENRYSFPAKVTVIDEIPHQFQRRDVGWEMMIDPGHQKILKYVLRPVKRGEYHFGALNIFASTQIGLIERRFRFNVDHMVKVYPSYMQMRKYGFAAIHQKLQQFGLKRQRRLGHTMEFEQIKEYVPGDDRRSINWKATGRRNTLMLNQFRDERSQQIFNVVDKGRLMRAPFDGLSLFDYAVNSSLVLSFIAINKHDKAGLISFGHRMSSYVPAAKRRSQMKLIQDALYHQKTKYLDANFERLGVFVSRQIKQRSLLLLYTNFESLSGLERQLPYIQAIAKKHVVVVIFFQNSGLQSLLNLKSKSLREVYHQTLAEKLLHEKQLIVKRLNQSGVHAVLTRPQDLTVNTINKYLELKGKGVI